MADARFCVGFSSACKQAREGGGLPGCEQELRSVTPDGIILTWPLRPFLPPDIVRLIDALVRRLEHEDTLLSMNGGDLGVPGLSARRRRRAGFWTCASCSGGERTRSP